jgi:hypothetical protein
MADAPKVGSPEWWLTRLHARLMAERPRLDLLDRYYWGDHPLAQIPPELHAKYLTQFQEILRQSRANFMQLVVDATANRLRVQGFRLSASKDEKADQESWDIWQASQMDAEHRLAVRDTLTKGRGALSVWGGEPFPVIAVEDACQTIVESEPGNRRKRAAALKVWVDDWTGVDRANVYLPDGIHKFQRIREADLPPNQLVPAVVPDKGPPPKEWIELADEFVKNPLGVVPIIPLVARPDSYGCGHSEIEGVLAIQDRINGTIFNRVLAGWFAAFRQKWATGVEIPIDPETNQPSEPWSQAITRMFVSESENAKFGTFDSTDLEPYLKAHEQDVKDIASITFTPRHFLIQQGQEPSGDAINSAEAGLNAKCMDRQQQLGESFEEALRLARRFAGDTDAPVDSEIVWADPRDPAVVEAAKTDAIIKQHAAQLISTSMAQEQLGYTPQEIERMSKDIVRESLAQQAVDLKGLVADAGSTGSQPPPR